MRMATFFAFQTTCYLNGHSFIEQPSTAGAQSCQHHLSQVRQRFSGCRERRGFAGGRRQAEPCHHPREARLGRSSPIRSARRSISRFLFDLADRILPQLHLQKALPPTRSSHAAVSWGCGGSQPSTSPKSSGSGYTARSPASSRPSSTRSSMAITSIGPTSSRPS
jgi:hypothetical protein